MNKKGQLEEINPFGLIGGVLGAIISVVVMSKVEVGIIFKIGAFIGTGIVCYIMCSKIFDN